MIQNDAQLHQAQADIQKLWRFLESARQTHGSADYERLAAPYLLTDSRTSARSAGLSVSETKTRGRMIPPMALFREARTGLFFMIIFFQNCPLLDSNPLPSPPRLIP